MELDKEQSPDEHGTENGLSSQPSPNGHCVHLHLDQGSRTQPSGDSSFQSSEQN